MLNLRDLIYGKEAQDEEEEKEERLQPLKGYGPFTTKRPIIPFHGQQAARGVSAKRSRLYSGYVDVPEALRENKDIPFFLPEYPAYFRYPQVDKSSHQLKRNALRELWNQAYFGRDFESAIKILMVMVDRSSVEFFDFYKYVTLLREHPDISADNFRSLARIAIQSKLPPSSRTDAAKALLKMFIQLFVVEEDIASASELLKQYISHPVMTQDTSLNAALAVLSCLEVIKFVNDMRQSFLSQPRDDRPQSVDDKSSSDSDDSDDSDDNSKEKSLPHLKKTPVLTALLCPSYHDIALNPFQFYSSVHILLQMSKMHSTHKIGDYSVQDIKRMLQNCCNHLSAAISNYDNSQCFDLHALCSGMLYATGKPKQAHRVMKSLSSKFPRSGQVCRMYIQYLSMFKYPKKRSTLVSALRKWIGRGNVMLERQAVSTSSTSSSSSSSSSSGLNHMISTMFVKAEAEEDGSSSEEEEMMSDSLPRPCTQLSVCDRSLEELEVSLLLWRLRLGSREDAVSVCCDVLEAHPPSLSSPHQASPGDASVFDSGYSDLHLTLWRTLACLLGPLPAYTDITTPLASRFVSVIKHQLPQLYEGALRSGVSWQHSSSSSCSSGDQLEEEPVDLAADHFTSIPLHCLTGRWYDFVNVCSRVKSQCDQSSSTTPATHTRPSEAREGRLGLCGYFREKYSYWTQEGSVFPSQCFGESFSRTVLESSARKSVQSVQTSSSLLSGMILTEQLPSILAPRDVCRRERYLNTFVDRQALGDQEPQGGGWGHGEDGSACEEAVELWRRLVEVTAESPKTFQLSSSSSSGSSLNSPHGRPHLPDFCVQKVEGCIRKDSPLWLNDASSKAKVIYHRLGSKLMEMFCYMVIVRCHLLGDQDDPFASRFAQVLVEQLELDVAPGELHEPASGSRRRRVDECIKCLEEAKFNLQRAVRVGNTLAGYDYNFLTPPTQTHVLPPDEELLVSSSSFPGKSRVSRVYDPL